MFRYKSILLIVSLAAVAITKSQQANYQSIKGLPTEEIYDIHNDKKGFVWVAHALGVSRYDGTSFTHFSSPEITNTGFTNLTEDNFGIIWCHNFSGQIFFISNEGMHLLREYNYNNEKYFPTITIIENQLLSTSSKGLFVYNLLTKKGEYITLPGKKISTRFLTAAGKSVVIVGEKNEDCYKYSIKGGLKKLFFKQSFKTDIELKEITLNPTAFKDTLYGFTNGKGVLHKLLLKNDTLQLLESRFNAGFINTITQYEKEIWIHTKRSSYNLNGKKIIRGLNLSDIIYDQNGNIWLSSLQLGLLMATSDPLVKKVRSPITQDNDPIRLMKHRAKYIVYGTQNGKVIIRNKVDQTEKIFQLPAAAGNIERIFFLSDDKILVGPSLGIYLISISQNNLFTLVKLGSLKDIAFTKNALYIASSTSLAKIENSDLVTFLQSQTNKKNQEKIFYDFLSKELTKIIKNQSFVENKRCLSVCITNSNSSVLASFKDGLYKINDNKVSKLLLNEQHIISSTLLHFENKNFIQTLNSGLLIMTNDIIKVVDINSGLLSNNIIQIKLIGDLLYIIMRDFIQIMDARTEKLIAAYPVSSDQTGSIYDIIQEENTLVISSAKGFYEFNINNKTNNTVPPVYILSITVDSTNLLLDSLKNLPYNKNSLQILLSSPSFTYPNNTYFQYRLIGSYDSSWKSLKAGQNRVSLASISPGTYKFEAFAVDYKKNKSITPAFFEFKIQKPWWQTNLFYILFSLSIFIVCVYLIRYRFLSLRKKDALTIEMLDIQNQLKKNQLTAIQSQMNPHFVFNALNTIQGFIYDNDKVNAGIYLGKFSELIRNTLEYSSKDYILLADEIKLLTNYLDLEKARFGDDLTVLFNIHVKLDPDLLMIPTMMIQPFIENAMKHGLLHIKGKKILKIDFELSDANLIKITIDDNGIGRERSKQLAINRKNNTGFGNMAIQTRIDLINNLNNSKIETKIIDKIDSRGNAAGTSVILFLPVKY